MDLRNLAIFSMATRRMSWLGKRQEVLAHNIANSDTPRYRPQDLKAQEFRKFLRPSVPRTQLATTQANHVLPLRGAPEFRSLKDKETYEVAPSGNAVVIEEQLMKVTETQGDYRLVTNLYQKHLSMLRAAIGADRR
jgi:flagellar basal-body rod protein FlgB